MNSKKSIGFKDFSYKHPKFKEDLDENGKWKRGYSPLPSTTEDVNKSSLEQYFTRDSNSLYTPPEFINNPSDKLSLGDFLTPSEQPSKTVQKSVSFKDVLKKNIDEPNESISILVKDTTQTESKLENSTTSNTNTELKGYWAMKKAQPTNLPESKQEVVQTSHYQESNTVESVNSYEIIQQYNTYPISHYSSNYSDFKINPVSNPSAIPIGTYNTCMNGLGSALKKSLLRLPNPVAFTNGNYSIVNNILQIKFYVDDNNNLDETSILMFYQENFNHMNELDMTLAFNGTMISNHTDYLNYFGSVSNTFDTQICKTMDGIKIYFNTYHSVPYKYLKQISLKYPNLVFYMKAYDNTNKLFYEDMIYKNGTNFHI